MKNLISSGVFIAIAMWTISANGQNVISHTTTACTAGDDIIYDCGTVTIDLPTGENFIVNDGTNDFITQKADGEFQQKNGNFQLFNDDDIGYDGAGGKYTPNADETYVTAVFDQTSVSGPEIALVGYQNTNTNVQHAAAADEFGASLNYINTSNGDNVRIEANNTHVVVEGLDNLGTTAGFIVESEDGTDAFWVYNDGDGQIDGDFLPNVDNSFDLGSSSLCWADIYSNNALNVCSDRRLKKDIIPLERGLDAIMQLYPVSYILKSDETNRTALGLIAQETEMVVPEVVSKGEDEQETMGIRYAELVPVLIKATQEQQAIIDEKDAQINDLNDRVTRLEALLLNDNGTNQAVKPQGNNISSSLHEATGTLGSNTPNPFSNSTTIRYTLNNTSSNAVISIISIDGKEILSRELESTYNGQVKIDLSSVERGIYFYSLIVNGDIVATKPMIKM